MPSFQDKLGRIYGLLSAPNMHTYNRLTYGAQRVAFASQEEEEGKKMHEDLGMSDAP